MNNEVNIININGHQVLEIPIVVAYCILGFGCICDNCNNDLVNDYKYYYIPCLDQVFL